MKAKKFYIKERHNPQFINQYYVAEGELPEKAAKWMEEGSAYGQTNMLAYETEREYLDAIKKFKEDGYIVHE
jgi:hypothetical protein